MANLDFIDKDGNPDPKYLDFLKEKVQTEGIEALDDDEVEILKAEAGGGGNGDFTRYTEGAQGRSMSNNFGYTNKPGILGLAKMAPIPMVGMAAKGADLVMSVNNRAAVNAARNSIGLEDKLGLGGFLRDPNGYVADVNIGPNNYPVGLEAKDNTGRTTLTPNEARMRSMVTNQPLTESSRDTRKESVKDFKSGKSTTPQDQLTQNIFSGATGYANPASENDYDQGEHIAKGLGLGDLSPSFRSRMENGINYQHPDRGPVTQGLQDYTVDTMDRLANFQPGGINVSSAYRDPGVNRSIGGAKNSLHMSGEAFDLSTKGLTDQEKRDLVERSVMAGAQEIGTYPDQSLHIGSRQRFGPVDPELTGGVTAMYDRSRYAYDQAPDWFQQGLEESRLAPTPTPRPEQPSNMIAENEDTKPSDSMGFLDSMAITDKMEGRDVYRGPGSETTVNPNRFKDITDEDRSLMGMTLAGELDPSKTDLSTPDGRREAMGILSTMENRQSKYGSIKDAIQAPNQYSTWNNDAASNTATKNYYGNQKAYDSLVSDYISDPTNNLGFTSYHANTVNPGWSGAMENKTTIGPHTFGFLKEYAPKSPDSMVTPTTVFNTTAMSAPKTAGGIASGMLSPENSLRSTPNTSNQPATTSSAQETKGFSSMGTGGSTESRSGSGFGGSGASMGSGRATTDSSPGKDKDDKSGFSGSRTY